MPKTKENVDSDQILISGLKQKTEKETNQEQKELYQKTLEQLDKAKDTMDRVEIFGKIMDNFGIDALVGLIPELGDIGSSLVCTIYLLYEGKKMGLGFWDTLKIVGYQAVDIAVGAIPFIGDIADYFFKANNKVTRIFEKHFNELKTQALILGLSPQDIAKIEQKNSKFLKALKKSSELAGKMKNNTIQKK